jgi:hypothetical protein
VGRPSKLSPDQWAEIAQRSAAGESSRALAKEFGVDESTVRAKVSPQTPRVREIAAKLAAAQEELATLPIPQQHVALSLAEKLRGISRDLAGAAAYGADTARRLKERANAEATKILAEPQIDVNRMSVVAGLTKLANESASIAQGLLAGGDRGTLKQIQLLEQGTPDKPDGDDEDMTPTFNVTLTNE